MSILVRPAQPFWPDRRPPPRRTTPAPPTELATTPVEEPADLRRTGLALRTLADEQREVEQAAAAARANGRSWGEVGLVLGVSRQAARERYGQPATAP